MDPNNIEEHSKEVREIMDNKPIWIIRSGIILLVLIFSIFLIASFFFKYPVTISIPIILEVKHDTLAPPGSIQQDTVIGYASLSPSEVKKVRIGQAVNIKLTPFPYTEYGIIHGQVKNISKIKEQLNQKVLIALPKGMVSNQGKTIKIIERADGTAEIIVQKVRLIHQLIPPIGKLIKAE